LEVSHTAKIAWAIEVVATPHRAEAAQHFILAGGVLAAQLKALRTKTKRVDVRTVVVVDTGPAKRIGCQETNAVGDAGWAAGGVVVQLGTTTKLTTVAAGVFAATTLGRARVVTAQLKGTTIIIAVAAIHTRGGGEVTVGAAERAFVVALTTWQLADAIASTGESARATRGGA
jgi:hypothetical protein